MDEYEVTTLERSDLGLEVLSRTELADRAVEHVRSVKGAEWWVVTCGCGFLEDCSTAADASDAVAEHSCMEWLEADRESVRAMEAEL